jgi:transposase-like protein
LYGKGLTTGEISAHFAEIYGVSVSSTVVSTITDKVVEEQQAWSSRPLQSHYVAVFVDAIHVKVRDGAVANRPFYAAIGVDLRGHRDVLGVWAGTPGAGESSKFWISILTELKNRGVVDIFYLVCDGLKGMPESVNTIYKETIVQTCLVHLIRNTFKYSSKRYWAEIARDLKPVYTAVNAAAAPRRVRIVRHEMGRKISGYRESLAGGLGQLRAVPRPGYRDPSPAQLHECHRVPECEIPEVDRRPRALPE